MRRVLRLLAFVALLAGCGSSATPTRPRPVDPGPRDPFAQQLAVLRRAAQPSDTTSALTATLAQRARYPGCLAQVAKPGLTRRVRPGLYLVVFAPARCTFHCTGTARACARPQPMQEWATLVPAAGPGLAGAWTSAALAAGQAFGLVGRQTALLVPDGVAQVRLGGEEEAVSQNLVLLPPNASARVRWLNAAGQVIRSYVL